MVKLETQRFGEIEFEDQAVITFEEGLPGFEHLTKFIVYKPSEDMPFSFLQSIEAGELAFIVVSPFLFYPQYEFEISEQFKQELSIRDEQDVMVWSIVSIRDSLESATINLLAPVILNARERLGKQIILQGTDYQIRHALVPAAQPEGGRG